MKHHIFTLKKYALSHKKTSILAAIILLLGCYFLYTKVFTSSPTQQYIQTTVKKGSISQTVTGSGQVSSENQLDIMSEVSGKITSIPAVVGQSVKAGDLLATIDSRDALLDLENARIAYAKITEPAKNGDITNATNNLSKAYSDAQNAIADLFVHAPTIVTGLKDMLYSRTGYLSDQQATGFSETGKKLQFTAGISYDMTNTAYGTILQEYKNLTKTSSMLEIETMLNKTYSFAKEISETVKNAQTAATFVAVSLPDYNPSGATSAAASLTTWSNQINSDISALLSAKNSIASYGDALQKLRDGADKLDIQSEQISLQQKERVYAKYFIRAPFDGIVGKIPVHVYDQANNGTVIATVASTRKVTTIPLNEVDAVKVAKDQKVTLTFDAIPKLRIDGTVTQVDLVGTVNQGVVTYNIKIAFDGSDERIRPGMSIDASIITHEKSDVLIVPAGAIKSKGAGKSQIYYVETLDSGNTVQEKIVTLGESDDTNTEIMSGLTEGEKIVARTISGSAKAPTPTIFSGLSGGTQRGATRAITR